MHKITIHNYEAFLLDLSEGNLTAPDQLELEAFMAAHPELFTDMEGLSFAIAPPEPLIFSHKGTLKKTETDLVSAEQFIGYIEHQLTPEESLSLEKSCMTNPALAVELKLYQHTIVQADHSVVFTDKERLKRKSRIIWLNFSAAQFAAAASVVLLLTLYFLWPSGKETTTPHALAHNSTQGKTIKPASEHSQANSLTKAPQNKLPLHTPSKTLPHALPHNTVHAPGNLAHSGQPNNNNNNTGLNQPDTLHPLITKEPETLPYKEQLALNATAVKPQTVVAIITETDEEDKTTPEKKKQGFWALAGKALSNLNKAGVKVVDGEESATKENATYALTLGDLNITHKTH